MREAENAVAYKQEGWWGGLQLLYPGSPRRVWAGGAGSSSSWVPPPMCLPLIWPCHQVAFPCSLHQQLASLAMEVLTLFSFRGCPWSSQGVGNRFSYRKPQRGCLCPPHPPFGTELT